MLDVDPFVQETVRMHRDRIELFMAMESVGLPDRSDPLGGPDALLTAAVTANHCFNCRLWKAEDEVRLPGASDAGVAKGKRAIDRFNQARNDAVEDIDDLLLGRLPLPSARARRHSETAGAMIDRLSILALKIHHMALQTGRADAAELHRMRCAERHEQLLRQRDDLTESLRELLHDCQAGRSRFSLYRQHKMYNDPSYRGASG